MRSMLWRVQIRATLAAVLASGVLLSACSGGGTADGTTQYPDDQNRKRAGGGQSYSDTSDGLFGSGLNILGGGDEKAPAGGAGIGVNSYLWRASLDTISFMPVASADPFGGVIITDWYAPPQSPAERFKVNLYILGRELRADGVRASVFRQVRNGADEWTDAQVDADTATELENAILARAREMRIASSK